MELIAIFARENLGECMVFWRLAQNFGDRYGINLGRHDYQVPPMKGKLTMNSVGKHRCESEGIGKIPSGLLTPVLPPLTAGQNAVFLKPISNFSAQLSVLLEAENAILPPLCFEVAKFSPCSSFGKENIGVAKDVCLLA